MLNKIILIGRITKDPEITTTTSGIPYLYFNLAINRQYKKDTTDFLPCTAWRTNATFIKDYIKKGDLVSVVGSLETSKYTDKQGNNRTSYTVTVDSVQKESSNPNNAHPTPVSNSVLADYEKKSLPNPLKPEIIPNKEEKNMGDLPWDQ